MENTASDVYGNNPSGENLILFLCYGNVYRSQWAEAFFNHINSNPKYRAVSAGAIHAEWFPDSIELMGEKGIDISDHVTKKVTDEMIENAYRIYDLAGYFSDINNGKRIDLYIEDPADENVDGKRQMRDQIEAKVVEILKELPRN